jgi:hypothetical protein
MLAGPVSELYIAPDSPSALDDEFLGTALDSRWVFRNSANSTIVPASTINPYSIASAGTARVQVGRPGWTSWAQIQIDNSGNRFSMCQPFAMPTNFFVWCRMAPYRTVSVRENQALGVLLLTADSGGLPDFNNRIYLGPQPDAGNFALEFASGVAGVFSITRGPSLSLGAGVLPYFGIQKIGTVFHGWAFDDNRNIHYFGSFTNAASFAHVGFQLLDETTGLPGSSVFSIDFIRGVSASSYLP